jgi:hypothetical protein
LDDAGEFLDDEAARAAEVTLHAEQHLEDGLLG